MKSYKNLNRASYFVLRHKQSKRVLDGSNGRTYLDDERGNEFQQWRFEPVGNRSIFIVRQKESGFVLTTDLNQVCLSRCVEHPDIGGALMQQWKLHECNDPQCVRLSSLQTGRALRGGDVSPLFLGDDSDDDSQQWTLEERVNPVHTHPLVFDQTQHFVLRHKQSKRVLDGSNGRMYFDEESGNDFQQWRFEPIGDNYHFVVRQKESRCVLTANQDGSMTLEPYRHENQQHWAMQGLDNNQYLRLINCQYDERALDGNGKTLYLYGLVDNDHQRWEMKGRSDQRETFPPDRWMEGLQDNLRLDQLTLPGTHDSATSLIDGSVFSAPLAICQSETIYEQLQTGIRFLDIRCRHNDNSLPIHHGSVYCGLNFDDVLKECAAFLGAHHSEVILMSVKPESGGNGGNDGINFPERVIKAFQRVIPGWKAQPIDALLSTLRGKIQLYNRFDETSGGFTSASGCYVQDMDDMSKNSVEEKQTKITETFYLAANTPTDKRLYVNFLSGAESGASAFLGNLNPFTRSIKDYSNLFNQEALANLPPGKQRLGVVPMDFPPAKLVYAL